MSSIKRKSTSGRGLLWYAMNGTALALSTALVAACTTTGGQNANVPGSKVSGDRIVIGVALPFSGPVARTGGLYRKGAELRVKEANAAGGVDGKKIELNMQDDANTPTQAVTLVSLFDKAGAVAMIGGHSSPVVLAQAAAVEAAGMPEIVFGASDKISNPFQYQVNSRDSEQIKNVLNFAKIKGFKSVATLTDTGAYGASAKDQLDKEFLGSNVKIVAEQTFDPTASNLTPQLLSVQKSHPDFIAMFTFGTPYGAVMQGRPQIGWDVPIIGNVAAGDIAIGAIAGKAANGLYYQSPLDVTSPAAKKLSDAWVKEYPTDPLTFEGGIAYDAISVLIRAIKEGGPNRADVQKWLNGANAIDGLVNGTSPWNMAAHTGFKAKDLVYRVWNNGKTAPANIGAVTPTP